MAEVSSKHRRTQFDSPPHRDARRTVAGAALENLLSRLHGTRSAGDGWSAKCPAHDDNRASLSVARTDDGTVLVRCHAGCTSQAIVRAVGLELRDLFPNEGARFAPTPARSPMNPRAKASHAQVVSAKSFDSAHDALATYASTLGKPTAVWTYRDASGEPVGAVGRWDTDAGKEVRPVAKIDGQWRLTAMPEPRPLYDLPDLASARHVYVVEGEKVADALKSLGLTATTSAGGSQAATKTDWTLLAGKDVVLLPDQDPPGETYVHEVATILTRLNPPARIRVVRLPGLPAKGDAVDWIVVNADKSKEELRAELERLAAEAQPLASETQPPASTSSKAKDVTFAPKLIRLSDVVATPVRWLWPGRIPLGRLTLLVGIPGAGKSYVTCDLAARVSRGTPWPDGSTCQRGSVLFVSAEDDPADTIRPRLDAHDADVSRVHLLSAVTMTRTNGDETETMFTLNDVDCLAESLARLPDCRLVVVDPIGSYLGSGCDSHRDNDVRAVLAPVAKLAADHEVAVVIVAHRRKGSSGTADESALGSRAFTGLARAAWHLSKDAENKDRRLMLPGKNNLAPEGTGLAFRIAGAPGVVTWEPNPVAMHADDALAEEHQDAGERTAKDEAAEWIVSKLSRGPMPSKEFQDAAKNDGIALKTLTRARSALSVKAGPREFGGKWMVWLPSHDSSTTDAESQSWPSFPKLAKDKTLVETGIRGRDWTP